MTPRGAAIYMAMTAAWCGFALWVVATDHRAHFGNLMPTVEGVLIGFIVLCLGIGAKCWRQGG